MPLHDLVEYFNDRFRREYQSSYRPFILKEKKVSGLFGPIRIDSSFSPIRHTLNPTVIVGHTAQIEVFSHAPQYLSEEDIENILLNNGQQSTHLDSIINFDRLSRTVHMLNYLTLLPLQGTLFLEVDPRHILSIKQDHGVYFGEVIEQCGLKTDNVVIALTVYNQYANYYQELLAGLDNYRQQGFQIALKFALLPPNNIAFELINKLSPNYVSISAKHLEYPIDNNLSKQLEQLTSLVAAIDGHSIFDHINQKKIDALARNANFDLVEGSYYRTIAFDYLGKLSASEYSYW
jgi:hypothetical protein